MRVSEADLLASRAAFAANRGRFCAQASASRCSVCDRAPRFPMRFIDSAAGFCVAMYERKCGDVQGLLALDRGNSHFCLECRAVVLARASCHGSLLARNIMLLKRRKIDPLDQLRAPPIRGKSTCPGCSVFSQPPFSSRRQSICTNCRTACQGKRVIDSWIGFYNAERPHTALEKRMP